MSDLKVFISGPKFAYPENLALFFENALNSLGATTAGIDLRTGTTWGSPGWHPDIFLVIKGMDVPYDLAPRMKKAHGCTTVLYFPDPLEDGENEKWLKANRDYYEYLFLACWYQHEKLEELQANWLPVAYDPQIHRVYSRPWSPETTKRKVVFVGTNRVGREWLPQVPGLEIFGNGWGTDHHEVYLKEKVDIYFESMMVLNQHYLDRGPNHRFFEGLACGGPILISDVCPGIEELGFKPREDFGFYEKGYSREVTYLNALKEIQYYSDVSHWEEMARVVVSGSNKVLAAHSYGSRMMELLRTVGR